jgi:hypothetical protein
MHSEFNLEDNSINDTADLFKKEEDNLINDTADLFKKEEDNSINNTNYVFSNLFNKKEDNSINNTTYLTNNLFNKEEDNSINNTTYLFNKDISLELNLSVFAILKKGQERNENLNNTTILFEDCLKKNELSYFGFCEIDLFSQIVNIKNEFINQGNSNINQFEFISNEEFVNIFHYNNNFSLASDNHLHNEQIRSKKEIF